MVYKVYSDRASYNYTVSIMVAKMHFCHNWSSIASSYRRWPHAMAQLIFNQWRSVQLCFARMLSLEDCVLVFCAAVFFAQQKTKAVRKCICNILLCKRFSCAKMHLMQKCIFATHHILLASLFYLVKNKAQPPLPWRFYHINDLLWSKDFILQ